METLTKKEVLDKKKIFDFLHLESSTEMDGREGDSRDGDGRDGDGRDGNRNGLSKEEMMRNVKNFVWIKKKVNHLDRHIQLRHTSILTWIVINQSIYTLVLLGIYKLFNLET